MFKILIINLNDIRIFDIYLNLLRFCFIHHLTNFIWVERPFMKVFRAYVFKGLLYKNFL